MKQLTVGLGNGHGREIAFSYIDQCLGFLNNIIIGYKFLLRLSIGVTYSAVSLFIDYDASQQTH